MTFMLGQKLSIEARAKMSAARKGVPWSKARRQVVILKAANSKLVGQRFNRLVVIKDYGYSKDNRTHRVECRCDCGKITKPQLHTIRIGRTKSCGCLQKEIMVQRCRAMSGEKHPNWKGGRQISWGPKGYIRVLKIGHSRACNGYVLEHIPVMETKLGRSLLPGETIHHINGAKHDNRPENLELWDSNHCPGQRHIEKMAFHLQELISKSSDEELDIIHAAIQIRIQQRKNKK